jgi:homoserine O-acetyltransferase/O-succinyltransferase
MPSQTDLNFPVADAQYESQFMVRVVLTPIPSLWGHAAGIGGNPADSSFIDAQIRRFLR